MKERGTVMVPLSELLLALERFLDRLLDDNGNFCIFAENLRT